MRSIPIARIATTEVREQLSDLVNAVAFGGSRIVLQRHGKNVAALVPLADLQQLGVRLDEEIPTWSESHTPRPG